MRRVMIVLALAAMLGAGFGIAPAAADKPIRGCPGNVSSVHPFTLMTQSEVWPLVQANYPNWTYDQFLAAWAASGVDKNQDLQICVQFVSDNPAYALPFNSVDNTSNAEH